MISLFTRKGADLRQALADAGYRLAEVVAHVRDGDLAILHVQVPRRQSRDVFQYVTAVDAECFCIINDVRMAKIPLQTNAKYTRPRSESLAFASPCPFQTLINLRQLFVTCYSFE